MLKMHMHAGFAGHVDVTFHDTQLGVFGNARNAQLSGYRPLVDGTGVMVLAMFDEIQAGFLDVGEHLIQNSGRHRGPVIADGGHRMGELVGVLPVIVMLRKIADPIGHVGGLLSGAPLGRAYA